MGDVFNLRELRLVSDVTADCARASVREEESSSDGLEGIGLCVFVCV